MTARLRDDASAATPLPPPVSKPVDDATSSTTPQGGDEVAAEVPRETGDATPAEAEPDPPATYEKHDVGIDEMWKPEHRGKFAP